MWQRIRKYGRVANAAFGFLYDFKRYVLYSAWNADMRDRETRNYHMAKLYHSLEKSLSFKERSLNSGWTAANLTLDTIKIADGLNDYGFHDKAALIALKNFIEHPDNAKNPCASLIKREIESLDRSGEGQHGAIRLKDLDFSRGVLNDPEAFFLSRYSLREFRQETVPFSQLARAISLAMKTPSVCNRQAWHVYHTSDSEVVSRAMSYQQGNRGFGHKVPNLMIITTDLKAFMPGQEHYQHWIDGGLFSMSLIYALHAIGIASCCLNWSQSPGNDQKLRAAFNIKPNHTVIMMLAFGYPEEENNVCVSARRPFDEIHTKLEVRSVRGLR